MAKKFSTGNFRQAIAMRGRALRQRMSELRARLRVDAARLWSRTPAQAGQWWQRLQSQPPWRYQLAAVVSAALWLADLFWWGIGAALLGAVSGSPATESELAVQTPRIEVPFVRATSHYAPVVSRNIFCPGCPVPDMQSRASERPKDCDKARPFAGGSGPRLLGTIVLSQPQYSVASVSIGSDAVALKQGETFRNFGRVFEIRRERVCFENQDGLLFYTELPQERSIQFGQPLPTAMPRATQRSEGIVRDDTNVSIERNFLLEQIQNPDILREALAVPYVENGELRGFQIVSINPGSVFEQLGFEPNDVITEVNGEAITTPARAQDLFSEITSIDQLNMTDLRGGRPVELNFNVN